MGLDRCRPSFSNIDKENISTRLKDLQLPMGGNLLGETDFLAANDLLLKFR